MFCGCGRFRFVVWVIYGTAVFIKSVFLNVVSSLLCIVDYDGCIEWPDLYYGRIIPVIRLGRAWAKNDSSSDNPSVYKHGQADGSSVLTSYPR